MNEQTNAYYATWQLDRSEDALNWWGEWNKQNVEIANSDLL